MSYIGPTPYCQFRCEFMREASGQVILEISSTFGCHICHMKHLLLSYAMHCTNGTRDLPFLDFTLLRLSR